MKKLCLMLCAFTLAALPTAGCQQAAPVPETGAASPAAPPAPEHAEPKQPFAGFKAGTWLASGGDAGQFYFFDAGGASGRTVSLEDGTERGFTCEQSGGKTILHMAEGGQPLPCEVTAADEEHLTLAWEARRAQTLTYYSPLGSDEFCFYTDEELCRMALKDYEAKYGLDGSGLMVGAEGGADGTVTLQICENLSGHNSTAVWYQVDRCTAKGTDVLTGDAVELANSPAELRIDFAPSELLEQPEAYEEYIAHDSAYQTKVVLMARIPLRNFQIVSLEPVDTGGQEFRLRVSGELYSAGTLTPEKPLVVGLEFPEIIPNLGVRYRDGGGAEKVCAFNDSGLDGTPLLLAVAAAEL